MRTLLNHPFAALGVSARDSDAVLLGKAKNAAPIVGAYAHVGAAYAALNNMSTSKRLAEEVAWFPGETDTAVKIALNFARAQQQGKPAPAPDAQNFQGRLSYFNAILPALNGWHCDTDAMLIAYCQSCCIAFEGIGQEEILAAVNADRRQAGYREADPFTLDQVLYEYLSTQARGLIQGKSGKLTPMVLRQMLIKIREDGSAGRYNVFLKELCAFYDDIVRGPRELMEKEIIDELTAKKNEVSLSADSLDESKKKIEKWHEISWPLRLSGNSISEKTNTILRLYMECIAHYVDVEKPVTVVKKLIGVRNINQSGTLTYQSKMDTYKRVLPHLEWIRDHCADVPEAVRQAKQDVERVREIEKQELIAVATKAAQQGFTVL